MGRPEKMTSRGVVPLRFDHLAAVPGIVHGVFPRTCGVSDGAFSGLNLGLGCGDDPALVAENRRLMLASLGLQRSVFLKQVHGTRIQVLKQGDTIKDNLWNPETGTTPVPLEGDGVVTDIPDVGLVIQVADCQAVVLYDPVRGVVGNVHSGWRGSISDILGKSVWVMTDAFGCRPEDMLAGISPSLGPCCAEFINYKEEIPEGLWQYKADGRPYFDFWRMSRDQLTACGVKQGNIQQMDLCTVCHTDRFFSYRGEKTTGRFGAVIALTK
ncbi:MAG TPA: peptidoglycan editing factor PgeF [Desulfobacteraceae bacterium]|nr:peptidoglycan editing factor PgeF [Desulfobacteraceae bacterium]|tara:strand:- start:47 stop:853 length:807 start_codon:yes stop_codon:yes gene_type:complete